MSNGENDFIDNAHRNTEFSVIDTWEEIDEHELNNKLNKIKTRSAQSSNELTNFTQEDHLGSLTLTTYDSGSHFSKMMINDGNYQSENCAQPSSTVKILKRPTENGNKVNDNLPKVKIPLKSLKQREKEYAEARLRILGSAVNPDDAKTATDMATSANQVRAPNQEELNRVVRMPSGPTAGSNGFKVRR